MTTAPSEKQSIHPSAVIECSEIGYQTCVGALSHVAGTARIGPGCAIENHVYIGERVFLGSRVTVRSGAQIPAWTTLDDDVVVDANATFAAPTGFTLGLPLDAAVRTTVRSSAFIGANTTIYFGVNIGTGSVIEAGAVVTRDVPPHAVVSGNPAVIKSYTRHAGQIAANKRSPATTQANEEYAATSGTRIVSLPEISDLRGSLSFAEVGKGLPFAPQRYFILYDVPTPEIRGGHAHRELQQFLVALHGKCHVAADDGTRRWETLLDSPSRGVHVMPNVWLNLFGFSTDCVLLVLASDVYRESDYIRNYDEFIACIAGKSAS